MSKQCVILDLKYCHGCKNERRQNKSIQLSFFPNHAASAGTCWWRNACCILRNAEMQFWIWDSMRLPCIVGLMGSASQESRNSVSINVEIIPSSRGQDKIVKQKIRPYSLAHPFGPASIRRIYEKKSSCWYCGSPQHRLWQRMLAPSSSGLWEPKEKITLRPKRDQMWNYLNIFILNLK